MFLITNKRQMYVYKNTQKWIFIRVVPFRQQKKQSKLIFIIAMISMVNILM